MISMEIKKMHEHNISFICSNIFLISMKIIFMNWHACSHGGIFVTLRGNVKLLCKSFVIVFRCVVCERREKHEYMINASALII